MAYDPVLDREMFRPKAKSKGLEDLRDSEDPAVIARREQALAMMEAAKQKFDPSNYQTLGEQDRPGVFRPVAVNMPAQQPTADTATRMQQMANMGMRPVGFDEGGLATVKKWIESGFGLEDVIPGLKGLRERNAERLQPTITAPELTQNAPEDADLPTPAELNLDRPLTPEEKENIRKGRDVFEKFSVLGPAIKGIRSLGKGEKPKAPAPKKEAAKTEAPKPGEPSFVGPTNTPPKPGEPNFVGPTQVPKPGEPSFVGPYQYGGQGSSGIPSVPQRLPGQLPPNRPNLMPRAASSVTQTEQGLFDQGIQDGEPTFGGPPRRLHGKPPAGPKIITGGGKQTPPEEKKAAEDKKISTDLSEIKRSREDALNTALMMAGLGMMAGKSSNALANIGEGGIMGLKAYTDQLAQARAEAAANRKLDLTERYYGMQEKRLNEMEALRKENLRKAYGAAVQKGEIAAQTAYQKWLETGANSTLSAEEKDAELQRLRNTFTNIYYNDYALGGGGSGSSNRLGLDLPGVSSEEE